VKTPDSAAAANSRKQRAILVQQNDNANELVSRLKIGVYEENREYLR